MGLSSSSSPETYIPAFPLWCALQAPIENHALFCQLAAGSLRVDGAEIGKVADAARRSGIFVSLGFNEVSAVSDGCLWNANLLLSDRGDILCHHRKLVPTFYEKLVWRRATAADCRCAKPDWVDWGC